MHLRKKILFIILILVLLGSSFSVAIKIDTNIRFSKSYIKDTVEFNYINENQSNISNQIWPMFGYNAQHTGKSPFDAIDNVGVELWKIETPRHITGEPVIATDGTIYVGSNTYLCAINPENASIKWKYYRVQDPSVRFTKSPAIGDDGTIYFGDNEDHIYAVDSYGVELWNISLGGHSSVQAPTIGADGIIYAGNLKGDFAAIYSNGTIRWKLIFDDAVYTPAIGENNIIYLGSHNAKLYAIHPNGTILWAFDADCSIANPSVDSDGTIYAPGCSGFGANQLYALYPNGTLKWKFIPDFQPYGTIANYPAIDDDTVYINTGEGKLYALDKETGEKKWSLELTDSKYGIVTAPAISADGILFVNCKVDIDGSEPNAKGYVYAITTDGDIIWESEMTCNQQYSTCDILSCPVIGDDGTVYCGSWFSGSTSYGYLHAFGSSESNNPPSAPIVNGPLKGNIDKTYDFQISTSDPESNNVYYFIDWGDDPHSDEPYTGWIGPYRSGEEITVNHSWAYNDTFDIRVKARDEHGLEGEWSTMKVIMPKQNFVQFPFFAYFLEKIRRLC